MATTSRSQKNFNAGDKLADLWTYWAFASYFILAAAVYLYFNVGNAEAILSRELSHLGLQFYFFPSSRLYIDLAALAVGLIAVSFLSRPALKWAIKWRKTFFVRLVATVDFSLAFVASWAALSYLPQVFSFLQDPRMNISSFAQVVALVIVIALIVSICFLATAIVSLRAFAETFMGVYREAAQVGLRDYVEEAHDFDVAVLKQIFLEEAVETTAQAMTLEKQWASMEPLENLHKFRVYRHGKQIRGFAIDSDAPARLRGIYVRAAYQKQKVGTALVKDFERRMRTEGFEQINTSFGVEYPIAVLLLKSCGWRLTKKQDGRGRPIYVKTIALPKD